MQNGLYHHDVSRWSLEVVEEAGDGHRVCQALSRAHDAHRRCLCECGRAAVREHRGGRERKSVRRRQLWCVRVLELSVVMFSDHNFHDFKI